MRTHVEVDPASASRASTPCAGSSATTPGRIDLEICVFPQEGLINDPGTEELLVAACEQGADLIGGCPYTDTHPNEHIARIFALARRFDLDIDFHLDFDLDRAWMHLDEVMRQTDAQATAAASRSAMSRSFRPFRLHAAGRDGAPAGRRRRRASPCCRPLTCS